MNELDHLPAVHKLSELSDFDQIVLGNYLGIMLFTFIVPLTVHVYQKETFGPNVW